MSLNVTEPRLDGQEGKAYRCRLVPGFSSEAGDSATESGQASPTAIALVLPMVHPVAEIVKALAAGLRRAGGSQVAHVCQRPGNVGQRRRGRTVRSRVAHHLHDAGVVRIGAIHVAQAVDCNSDWRLQASEDRVSEPLTGTSRMDALFSSCTYILPAASALTPTGATPESSVVCV